MNSKKKHKEEPKEEPSQVDIWAKSTGFGLDELVKTVKDCKASSIAAWCRHGPAHSARQSPVSAAGRSGGQPMHIQSLAEAVDGRTVLRFAVSTARDIKVTAPVAGMICRLSTPKRYWYYTGSIWTQLAPAPVHKAKHEKHKKHARGVRGVRGAS